jgi:hypothetical protein
MRLNPIVIADLIGSEIETLVGRDKLGCAHLKEDENRSLTKLSANRSRARLPPAMPGYWIAGLGR